MTIHVSESFAILNDLHYDPTYWTTQESCTGHPIPESELGRWGNYNCDSPWELIERAIDGVYEKLQNPAFVAYLG